MLKLIVPNDHNESYTQRNYEVLGYVLLMYSEELQRMQGVTLVDATNFMS